MGEDLPNRPVAHRVGHERVGVDEDDHVRSLPQGLMRTTSPRFTSPLVPRPGGDWPGLRLGQTGLRLVGHLLYDVSSPPVQLAINRFVDVGVQQWVDLLRWAHRDDVAIEPDQLQDGDPSAGYAAIRRSQRSLRSQEYPINDNRCRRRSDPEHRFSRGCLDGLHRCGIHDSHGAPVESLLSTGECRTYD